MSDATFDYYKALALTRDADSEALRRAYRKVGRVDRAEDGGRFGVRSMREEADSRRLKGHKAEIGLALRHHPDKDPSPASQATFSRISEAYEVLSDPRLRAIYDQYGSDGLVHGVPARARYDATEPGSEAPGFPGWTGGYAYHGRPERTFEKFSGGGNPYRDLHPDPSPAPGLPPTFGGLHGLNPQTTPPGHTPPKPDPTVLPLPLPLTSLYSGCVHTLSFSRLTVHPDSTTMLTSSSVRLEVPPGCRPGTRAVFPGAGDQVPGGESGDVVVVVSAVPEPGRTRDGEDLVVDRTVGLKEALCGGVAEVDTLDGRTVRVALGEVLRPGYTKRIPNEGFPVPQPVGEAPIPPSARKRGDLVLRFNVTFPTYLTEAQKAFVEIGLDKERSAEEMRRRGEGRAKVVVGSAQESGEAEQ
ncbi:hypothetical protein M427DRAFT_65950 [Gonapodya prolifera JEL478]|uniref:J domain-containing protein n=1 Tax=Gonapodya prolifera (strain JEL478) TaxID=1344416 RepID=A0A139AWP9_GONPJ|nr:hypothetical protein M427DRAFT_65950 [Gonapodya prolifera JEL478]|eukprot:KXS21172.1 hypothetical protein M427DRAFT_65950 [Gonapodya prolifera JEL478]